jgi:hypothetical protein
VPFEVLGGDRAGFGTYAAQIRLAATATSANVSTVD